MVLVHIFTYKTFVPDHTASFAALVESYDLSYKSLFIYLRPLLSQKVTLRHDFVNNRSKTLSFKIPWITKGGFFSESAMCFSNLQKNIFPKTILNLKFKFQAQDCFLEYFNFGDFEI